MTTPKFTVWGIENDGPLDEQLWVVAEADTCTCGGGIAEVSYAHERGCGHEPVIQLSRAVAPWFADQLNMIEAIDQLHVPFTYRSKYTVLDGKLSCVQDCLGGWPCPTHVALHPECKENCEHPSTKEVQL